MKTTLKTLIISSLGVAACLALTFVFVPKAHAAGSPNQTAQSVMVTVDTESSNFITTGNEVWFYDATCARTHFTNTLTSGPEISCTGGGSGGVNCLPANQPATPSAPVPDSTKLNGPVGCNSCNFWDGTALSDSCGSSLGTYKQNLTLDGVNGRGNWKFEWTYTTALADPNFVPAAQMCWNLQSSSTTQAELIFDVGIFSQSELSKPTTGRKASFTLTDAGGDRVQDLHYSVRDGDGNEVASGDLADTITSQCNNTGDSFYDVLYNANAGSNGVLSLLQDNQTIGYILNHDSFANNDTTVAGACSNVDKATASASGIFVDDGSYTLTITGTVKGVSASLDDHFSVTSTICVSAGTCSVCTP
jgi:hypothetical protein